MKIYTCTNFKGHYPVGTAAVVVANNRQEAERVLEDELHNLNLPQDRHWEPRLTEALTDTAYAIILNTGDY